MLQLNALRKGILFLFCMILISGCQEQIAKVGEKAPSIAVFDSEQNQITLEQFNGKPVIVEFWSEDCGACIAMMDKWQSVLQTRSDEVTLIGINIDEKNIDLKAFAHKYGLTFLLGADQLGITKERYQVAVTPTTYFINRAGDIVSQHIGFSYELDLDKAVSSLVNK